MKTIYKLSLALLLSGIPFSYVCADYLVVSRNAKIKEQPVKKGIEIETAHKGDTLDLLDDGVQSGGYYHVLGPKTGRDGWIYRTLARRYERVETVVEEPGTNCDPDNPPSIAIEYVSAMPESYYQVVEDLTGNALKAGLNNIVSGHTEFPYTSTKTDVWDILKETDKVPGCPDYVKLLYTNRMRPAGAEYNSGKGWTREHVWAKSHGDFGTTYGAGTDAHHLRPVDASVNSTRNNKDFDTGGEEYIDGEFASGCLRDIDSWEPRDSDKGDVARMIFYMVVRYEGKDGDPDLELKDGVNSFDDNTIVGGISLGFHGHMSTLLEWHQLDPVDNWERRRNDIIDLNFQGNRNPFIDDPTFAERIWGN